MTWNPHKLLGTLLQCSTLHIKENVSTPHTHSPPWFWKYPPQTTTCVTSDAKQSTALDLCLQRQVEWISTVEQCGLLGILCHTGGSLQEDLWALGINNAMLEGLSMYIPFIIFRSICVQSLRTTTIYCVTGKDYLGGNFILICRVHLSVKMIPSQSWTVKQLNIILCHRPLVKT